MVRDLLTHWSLIQAQLAHSHNYLKTSLLARAKSYVHNNKTYYVRTFES